MGNNPHNEIVRTYIMAKFTTNNIRYINLTDGTSLAEYIAQVCIDAKTLKDKIQIAGVGVLMHVGKHGNKVQACDHANSLTTGLGQGIQVQALIDWFSAHGMPYNAEAQEFTADMVDIDAIKKHFVAAKATHWVSFAPDKPYMGYKDDDKLEAYLKAGNDAIALKSTDTTKASKIEVNELRLTTIEAISKLSDGKLKELMQTLNLTTNTSGDATTITEDFTAGLQAA